MPFANLINPVIAHPINAECRQRIQEKVIAAFKAEVEKSKKPDYKPIELDEENDDGSRPC